LEYFIYLVEDEDDHIDLFIKKIETNTTTNEEQEHLLQWAYTINGQHLDIFVDEMLLYQLDTPPEPEKLNEIIEKLDKF
jgi:hypothetical protein